MGTFAPAALFVDAAVEQGLLGLFARYRLTRRRTPGARTRPAVINLPGGAHTAGERYRGIRNGMDRDPARRHGGPREDDRDTRD